MLCQRSHQKVKHVHQEPVSFRHFDTQLPLADDVLRDRFVISNGIPFVYNFDLEGLDLKVERNPIAHYRGPTYET